jgi:glutaconate CoA-transferase subunit B
VLAREEAGSELQLTGIHAGVDVETVIKSTGWALKIHPDLQIIPSPSGDELELLRTEIDPTGMYLRS